MDIIKYPLFLMRIIKKLSTQFIRDISNPLLLDNNVRQLRFIIRKIYRRQMVWKCAALINTLCAIGFECDRYKHNPWSL